MPKQIGPYGLIDLESIIQVDHLVTIHYFEYSKHFFFAGERHDFWEFLYVDKGSVHVSTDQDRYSLQQGDIIFHQPMEFHTVEANKKVAPNLVVISFVAQSPAMDYFKGKIFQLSPEMRQDLGQILRLASQVFSTPLSDPQTKVYKKRPDRPLGSDQLILINLERFLLHCLGLGLGHTDPALSFPPMLIESESVQVSQIMDLMASNLHQSWTLDRICQEVHMSPSSLNKLFKKYCQMTVLQYLKHLKVEKAKDLIRQDLYNFSEIARQLNYQSIHYFSRLFKAHTGMTLSQYKSSVKKHLDL